jgi:hypothetical protein
MGVKEHYTVVQANSLGLDKEMFQLDDYFDYALYCA